MLSVGIESCGMQWISCKDSCGSWFDVVSIFADLTRYLKVNIKMPPSSKQELWWNGFGPNFQTAEALEIQKLLLNSVLFSFQTGALRCLAKRPAHFPCSSHVFHHFHQSRFSVHIRNVLPVSRVPQMSNSYGWSTATKNARKVHRAPTFWRLGLSTSKEKQLTTSPRMRATRRWWTSWNQFLGISKGGSDVKKWSRIHGMRKIRRVTIKKRWYFATQIAPPQWSSMTNSKGGSCKIWGLETCYNV